MITRHRSSPLALISVNLFGWIESINFRHYPAAAEPSLDGPKILVLLRFLSFFPPEVPFELLRSNAPTARSYLEKEGDRRRREE